MKYKKVYLHTEEAARTNGELDLYRESLSLNMACALAIEDVINKRDAENGYQYNPGTIQDVLDRFGQERVLSVLAHTVRETDDGRFSQANRDWAKDFPAQPRSRHASFTVNAHPVIVDGFVNQFRNAVLGASLQADNNYIDMLMKRECTTDEKAFCRELFAAMHEASAERTDPAKLVYPYDFQTANERGESAYYHESRKLNVECARAIDEAIHSSCYKPNYYNLELAAMTAIHDFGFNRVSLVLAHNFQQREYDGRFSSVNKQWAREFTAPEKAFDGAVLNAHPTLIEDFTNYIRKLYSDVGAERFALPGRPESGDIHNGYEIVRAIYFDDYSGFAIGLDPEATNTFVAWRFQVEEYGRDYFWANYASNFGSVAQDYIARILVNMKDNGVREIPNPLAAVEMSKEQNYNMIDGLRNNEAFSKLDLTDGQTHEEIRELASETPSDEKASVMDQIREAWKAPKPPCSSKPERERKASELER